MCTSRPRTGVFVGSFLLISSAVAQAVPPARPGGGAAPGEATKSSPRFEKLDSGLDRLLVEGEPLESALLRGYRVRDGRIQVVATTDGVETARAVAVWLEARGAEFVVTAGADVQGWVDRTTLGDLGRTPGVLAVHRPRYYREPEPEPHVGAQLRTAAMLAGSYTSEAIDAMNVPAWHAAGYTGQGVKVGIIDSGFGDDTVHYDQLLGSDLPSPGMVHTQLFGVSDLYGSVHGLGCAEVVYDIAPGAEMYLAAYDSTPANIVAAINWMQANGVKVITMSQGWLSWGPGDGTGPLANAINAFVAAGGVWVNSAGNSRLAHWQGTWRDDEGNGWMNYDASYEINFVLLSDRSDVVSIPVGKGVHAALVWNQWTNPATDLDFYLYRYDEATSSWVQVAVSDDYQDGQPGQLPVEEISFTTTEAGYYGFAIKLVSGPSNVQMEYFNRFDSNPLYFNVQDGSITPPADTAGAIAAAALDAYSPFALQSYSSKGPANGPGGALAGGAVKPDIGGFANVSSNAYGARGATGGFGGTSAASPHVAGAAVLVRCAYPSYTPAQVRSLLESRAVDMGAAGKDTDYGVGRLTLGTPPSSSCTAPGTPGSLAASASSVGSGVSYTLTWGASATADGYELQEATSVSFAGATSFTTTAVSRAFSHAPSATTTYYYRVRGTRSCGSQSAWSGSAVVTVAGGGSGGGTYSYWLPVVANLAGSGGSYFYSDVSTLNVGSSPVTVEFRYYAPGGLVSGQGNTPIPVGGQGIYRDIVGQFQENGTKGVMEVRAAQPLKVTSRTYNKLAGGNSLGLAAGTSFGQSIEAYTAADGLAAGQSAYLPGLTENAFYRTNIAVANFGPVPASVTVTLYNGSGAALTSYTVGLAVGELKQETQPFIGKANLSSLDSGWAKVTVNSGSGVVAYASMLDNVATGGQKPSDPTTVLMKP